MNVDIVEDDILARIGGVTDDDPSIGVQPSSGGDVVQGDIPHGDQRVGRANRRTKWISNGISYTYMKNNHRIYITMIYPPPYRISQPIKVPSGWFICCGPIQMGHHSASVMVTLLYVMF